MVNSYQCIPKSDVVKIKSRKHKCGYRLKKIDYYQHNYVINYEDMTDELKESLCGKHKGNDTYSFQWDYPDVEDELRGDKEHKRAMWIANTLIVMAVSVMACAVATLFYILTEAIFGAN